MNWFYIITAYLSLLCLGLIDNSRGPAYPDILNFFGITTSIGSWMFALVTLASLVASILSKFWIPRLGVIKGIRSALIIQSIATFGLGLSGHYPAPLGVHLLFIFSFIFGLSSGMFSISMNLMVVKGSLPHYRRKALNGLHSMYGISSFLAPLVMTLFVEQGSDWRMCFKVLALMPLLVLALSFIIKRRVLKKNPELNEVMAAAQVAAKEHQKFIPLKDHVYMAAIFAMGVCAEISLSTQTVFFARSAFHYPQAEASFFLSLFFLLMLAGRLMFSIFHFPRGGRFWPTVSVVSTFVFFLAGLFIHPIALSLCGLTISIFYPCSMDWLGEAYSDGLEKIIPSVNIGVGIMLVTMHWGIGQLSSKIGIQYALLVGPIALVIAFFLLSCSRAKQR